MKKMLAIAVAAAFAAPAIATADTTLYGKLNAQLVTGEVGNGNAETDMFDSGSRLGIKGSTPLDNGLAATYKLEYGLNFDDGALGGSARQSYVGIKGGFGEIRAGGMYGPLKLSSGKVEMFGDRIGDYNGNRGNAQSGAGMKESEGTISDSIAYVNKFGNVGVAVLASEDEATTEGMVNYSNNGLYLALAHSDMGSVRTTTSNGNTITTPENATRLTAAYKFPAGHQVGAAYETADYNAANDQDSYVVSGKYQMGKAALKLQHQNTDNVDGGTNDANQTTIGMDYKLGKKTTLNADIMSGENSSNQDVDAYAVGIMHSF